MSESITGQNSQCFADNPEIIFNNSPAAPWFKIEPTHSSDECAFTS